MHFRHAELLELGNVRSNFIGTTLHTVLRDIYFFKR